MEVKRKEVVIVKDIYVACDGTEFENEDDCIDYECKLAENKLRCYDKNFEEAGLEGCDYVDATTEESLKLFRELCTHYGFDQTGIEGVGLYWYEPRSDTWVNISQIMSDFENRKRKVSEE